MERERPGRSSGYARDVGIDARAQGPEPVRQSHEEISAERVANFRRDAHAAEVDAGKLAHQQQRQAWRDDKASLDENKRRLEAALPDRRSDAATAGTEKAREDLHAAELALKTLNDTLANAKEPRARPPVGRELELEASIQAKSANPDDVLGWVASLSNSERSALSARLDEARSGKAPEDRDTFAIELANYLAATRSLKQFRAVLANPERYNAAAHRRAIETRSVGADAPAAANASESENPKSRDASATEEPRQPSAEPAVLSDEAAKTTAQDPDAVLRQVLDSPEVAPSAFMVLDGTTRRTLARRLSGYRPGSGDELGARFVRLDRAVQNEILDALHGKSIATPVPAAAPAATLAATPATPSATGQASAIVQLDAPAGAAPMTGPRAGMGDVHVAEAKQNATTPEPPRPSLDEPELPGLQMVSSESELLRLLQPVGPDPAAIAQRKHALAQLLAAVPERERTIVKARMGNPLDAIGALVSRLDWSTHVAAFEAIAGGVAPAPLAADAGSWAGFLAALGPEFGSARFHVPDVAIDGLWKQSATANLIAEPGLGPPIPSTGAELHVSVKGVTGEVTRRQVAWWPAGVPSLSGVPLQLDGVGRHEVVIDVVIDGLVRKRIAVPALVRLAAKSIDIAKDVSADEVRTAGASMSDADVTAQSIAIREQLRAHEVPGADLAADKEYQHLRAMLSELEWQAHVRSGKDEKGNEGQALDTGAPTPTGADFSDPGSFQDRAALRASLEPLIAHHGFNEARNRARDQIGKEARAKQHKQDGGGNPNAYRAALEWERAAWRIVEQEIDAIEAEHANDIEPFAADAQSIALAMLDRSEAEIHSELERYGIAKTGNYTKDNIASPQREVWGAQGNEQQMAELSRLAERAHQLGQMKLTLDRYVNEVRGSADVYSETDRGTPEKIEAMTLLYMVSLQTALKEFPSIALFLPGNGDHPNRITLDDMGTAAGGGAHAGRAVAPGLGFEMGQKLNDIASSRARLLSSPREALALPKFVALAKSHRHIVPGSLNDRVIDEAVAKRGGSDWTDRLLMVLQLALTVGVAVANPIVGAAAAAGEASTAALVATAVANVGMIAWDMTSLMEMTGEMRTLQAYNNTSIDRAAALLDDLPSGWMVLLSAIMTGVGVGSAGRELRALGKTADVGRLATAKESVSIGKSLRDALREAGGDVNHPSVVKLQMQLREIAHRVMGTEKGDAFLRDVLPQLGAITREGRAAFSSGKTLAEVDVQRVAQQVGVERITLAKDGVAVRVVYADRGGHLAVPELIARHDVDVQLVLDHVDTIKAVKRYNRTIDELRDAMGRATSKADHEVAAELAKHERILGERRLALAEALERGDANAAGRLDDEILFYEGEARHWQEVAARGDHVERGFIEGLDTETTREAIKNHYPELPDGYFYRRWSNGGDPALPEYQVVRGSTVAKNGPQYHVKREGTGWELVEGDRTGDKVAKVYAPGSETKEVFTDLLQRSESLRQYGEVMADLEKKTAKAAGYYRDRMEKIVGERQSTSAASRRVNPGEVDEEMLRGAIKEELRADVLKYLDTLGPEEAAREFQAIAKKLNGSDLGNLGEDWYRARFAPGGEAHAHASREALAGGRPPITIERDRFIDSLLPDGTAVEIKSISGPLSKREHEQIKDTFKMLDANAEIGAAGVQVKRVKYVFTRPEGFKANLDQLEDWLREFEGRFSCEVFLRDGTKKTIKSVDKLKEVSALL